MYMDEQQQIMNIEVLIYITIAAFLFIFISQYYWNSDNSCNNDFNVTIFTKHHLNFSLTIINILVHFIINEC